MRSSQSPAKRKRGLQQLNNSSPHVTTSSDSSLKRRRLNAYGPSKTGPIEVLKKAFGGVFGYGSTEVEQPSEEASEAVDSRHSQRDGSAEDAEVQATLDGIDGHDELNDSAENGSTPSKNGKRRSNGDDVTSNSKKGQLKRVPRLRASDYGAHDDELALEDSEVVGEDEEDSVHLTPSKKSSGRKEMTSKPTREDSVTSTPESSVAGQTPSESAGRSLRRERKRPRRFSNEMLDSVKQETKSILTPTKNKLKRPRKSVAFQVGEVDDLDLGFKDIPNTDATDTVRGRKATPAKKLLYGSAIDTTPNLDTEAEHESVEVLEEPAVQRRKPGRPKKASQSKANGTVTAVVEEEADDDTVCVICKGGDSEEPNEILMCDNCDLAVHQQCYNITSIPEGDWFCRDCRPDDGIIAVDIEAAAEPLVSIPGLSSSGPDIDEIDYHLQIMQRLLLEKVTGRRRLKLRGLKEELSKVHQVVEQTILAGEGNSMLVIGSRGCGKTTLVETVLEDLSERHRENFHIVRLNGFVHTDDKLALREIWRQLGREMEVEDELTTKASSFADTLASLLALLSHPSEISEENEGQTAKSVIFVLDEFDLFTTHPRQTLLYNLFDIAQSRKAPIAILGLTTKIDVVESLEKRVKSRFSHRYVHLPLPKSLGIFWEICKAGISVNLAEIVEQGFDPGLAGQDEFLSYWNSMLDTLYTQDTLFQNHLQTHFYRSKSVPSFLTTCILPIASLTPSSLPLTGKSFATSTISLSAPDSKLHLLQSLAELDLAMLIAAARLDIILDTDTCNFAMAYDEYSNLTSKHKIQTSSTGVAALGSSAKVWGREVAMGSWERLIETELLIPAGLGVTGIAGREVGREGKMWRVDVGLEEIPGSVEGLSNIMTKWCREI